MEEVVLAHFLRSAAQSLYRHTSDNTLKLHKHSSSYIITLCNKTWHHSTQNYLPRGPRDKRQIIRPSLLWLNSHFKTGCRSEESAAYDVLLPLRRRKFSVSCTQFAIQVLFFSPSFLSTPMSLPCSCFSRCQLPKMLCARMQRRTTKSSIH